jgi:TPR repeat protein
MKANRLRWFLHFLLVSAVFQLPAQQSDADRKALAGVRAKAEKGDAESQCLLGSVFLSGKLGVAKDEVEAVKWYRKAAEQNLADAQFNMGECYANGQGVAKNEAEAVKWYRKAAEQKDAKTESNLGECYEKGQGVAKDEAEAVKWYRNAAEQNLAYAQFNLGVCYANGQGVAKNEAEKVKWYRKAAEQNFADAQFNLGVCYANGQGEAKDAAEAVKWYRKAAEQDHAPAQFNLGACYANGQGVPKDYLQAYKWMNLALAQGEEYADRYLPDIERKMTPEQIAEAQRLTREFKPRMALDSGSSASERDIAAQQPTASGTGFFITDDGFLITNEHVVRNAVQVRLVTSTGPIIATVVRADSANDLALLKATHKSTSLPIAASRTVKLGGTVATVGFPNIGLQGFAPKLAKGEIASLSGAGDDPRYFQISVPVQPGNSGGALVDERGNVVGVVSAKLSARAALATSGVLPENVNYAVKSSFLLSFLESVPEVSAKLKEPNTKERKFEDVVKSAEQAAVLVLVY